MIMMIRREKAKTDEHRLESLCSRDILAARENVKMILPAAEKFSPLTLTRAPRRGERG
jgi:hypothetical protein